MDESFFFFCVWADRKKWTGVWNQDVCNLISGLFIIIRRGVRPKVLNLVPCATKPVDIETIAAKKKEEEEPEIENNSQPLANCQRRLADAYLSLQHARFKGPRTLVGDPKTDPFMFIRSEKKRSSSI